MENLEFYEKLRAVPQTAIKPIAAGRLKGKSDINPMWRIKAMTETFGVCGIGWRYEIVKQWTEQHGQEVKAYCNINLYIKVDGEWSEPIPGTGGSSEVEVQRTGVYVSDECYKMALTDALSVSMKALGVAADIYYQNDATKYNQSETEPSQSAQQAQPMKPQGDYSNFKSVDDEIATQLVYALPQIEQAQDIVDLKKIWEAFPALQTVHDFTAKMTERRVSLGINKKGAAA